MTTLADIIRPGVSRGLDFVTIEELRKRTGVTPEVVVPFTLSEILCNALDKDATQINIDIQTDVGFDRLTVSDNGSKKLSRSELELILDFENKASSKRGFLRVSRGYLGNALKCIVGFSYALAESKGLTPPPTTITSGAYQYTISLKPDRIRAVIDAEIVQTDRQDDGYTSFTVKFARDEGAQSIDRSILKNIIYATSMVNPTRNISFKVYGENGELGTAQQGKTIRQETSVAWYALKQFSELFEDFLRTSPNAELKDFISMFRGFTGRKIIREILQELNASNHDSQSASTVQFFPTSMLKEVSDRSIGKLFVIMKAKAKPISKRSVPAVLGCVGEDSFRRTQQQYGWKRLKYILLTGSNGKCPDYYNHVFGSCRNIDHVEYPYIVELAVFDRTDGNGLEVYQCVNFMASTQPIFSNTFDIKYRLGRVGINIASPMTIVAHLICPVLPWLNYGKSALGNVDCYGLIEKAFNKLLPIPKTPREYHPPLPARPLSWVPHGKLGDAWYEERLSSFASEIKALQRQRTSTVKYSSRGWCYQLEGLGKIHKGEFDACQKTINDCRKIGLLPIDFVAEDQDTTRHFKGIHNASDPTALLRQIKNDVGEMLHSLPSNITDYWIGEKYYLMMCVEKGDLLNLFKPICDEYHVPVVSSKGWAPILLRSHMAELSKKAEANRITPVLLLFYDHDPAGLKITQTFRKNLADCMRATGWNPDKLIIERFGLNKDDIDRLGLTWISNIQTGSGRESRDLEYSEKYGRRKCEANALFKNDDTLKAGMEICRKTIEKYYGVDAKERFKQKETESRKKLYQIYDDPAWQNFDRAINNILDSFTIEELGKAKDESVYLPEAEVDVLIDNKFYGRCPKCGTQFNYSETDAGRLLSCRSCNQPMRLKWSSEEPKP